MNRGKHWSLLVVRGDGRRVMRIRVPRSLPLVILAALAVLVGSLVGLARDRWLSRTRIQEVASLLREVDFHRATIAGLNRRIADVQTEIASWREVHTRIWESFGPDGAAGGRRTGIGGPSATSADASLARLAHAGGAERLTEVVRAEGESLRALERLVSRAGKALASLPSRWPVRGTVNSEFGGRRSPWTKESEFHTGMDIAAERGTPVHAPAAGTVAFAGAHAEYGLTVMIDHGDELKTVYGHLSKVLVAQGQKLGRGAELGRTGNTGRSSGPHLHYEILVQNRPVNPRGYLWE